MANKTAGIRINVTKADGTRTFAKPVQYANGSLKEGWAEIKGEQLHFKGANYWITWYENGKKKWEKVGPSAADARTFQKRREATLVAVNHGVDVRTDEDASRVTVVTAVAQYVGDIAAEKSAKTAAGYARYLTLFQQSFTKTYMDQITEEDLKDFLRYLRGTQFDYSKRTIYNIFQGINTWLRANKVMIGGELLGRLNYDEKIVTAYSEEELKALFAHCDAEERMLWEFFGFSGCREGEVAHVMYKDVDFTKNTLHIQPKPEWDWKVKDHEDRYVPLPASLVAKLKAHKGSSKPGDLIFPNKDGRPQGHFLRMLQETAAEAKLDGHWELHKFRKAFASLHHDAGVPVNTIRIWLGHASLDVTIAYLKGKEAAHPVAQAQVNKLAAAFD